jgi:hypothetical protein
MQQSFVLQVLLIAAKRLPHVENSSTASRLDCRFGNVNTVLMVRIGWVGKMRVVHRIMVNTASITITTGIVITRSMTIPTIDRWSSKFVNADRFELRATFDAAHIFRHDDEHISPGETGYGARSLIRQNLGSGPMHSTFERRPDKLFAT